MKSDIMKIKNIPEPTNKKTTEVDVEIRRPFGISKEEFTDDYKEHLRQMQKTRPDLFDKIMSGD